RTARAGRGAGRGAAACDQPGRRVQHQAGQGGRRLARRRPAGRHAGGGAAMMRARARRVACRAAAAGAALAGLWLLAAEPALAQSLPAVTVAEQDGVETYSLSIQVLALMTALTVLPALLRSEEHTSELQSRENLVCRLLLEKKKIHTSSAV